MSRARNVVLATLAFAGAYALGRLTTETGGTATERVVERGPERTERTIIQQRSVGVSLDDVLRHPTIAALVEHLKTAG